MNELLQDARKRKYAVGGFNVFNFETLGAVIEVAEELKTPLVLGVPERLFKFVDVETLSAAMVKAAQKSSVPIALHLDHGYSLEGVMVPFAGDLLLLCLTVPACRSKKI